MYLDKYLKERNTKYIFLNFILLPTVVFFNRGIFVFGFYFQSLFLLLTNGFGLQRGLARHDCPYRLRSGDSSASGVRWNEPDCT